MLLFKKLLENVKLKNLKTIKKLHRKEKILQLLYYVCKEISMETNQVVFLMQSIFYNKIYKIKKCKQI